MHPFRIAASAPSTPSAARAANGAPSAPSAAHAAGFLKKPVALVMLSRPCSQLEMVSGGGSPPRPPTPPPAAAELIGPSAAKFYNLYVEASTSAASASPAKERRKWGKRKLSYTFDSSFPEDNEAKQAVVRAFLEWERVSEFSFIPCDDGFPDIVISMHSTAYTAGVSSPSTASGYWPTPLRPQAGRSISTVTGIGPTVSTGLPTDPAASTCRAWPCRNKNAVMYKSIKPGQMKRQLTKVDIGRLKSLYL